MEADKWFTRGWTLQELLAPPHLIFFNRSWSMLGTKKDFKQEILRATNIREAHLFGDFRTASIATKMSWASQRVTTEPEHMAYSLLGIFDITMSIEYGEGRRAFIRLQRLLLENVDDESIFAWFKKDISDHGLFAAWPDYFANSGTITNQSYKSKPRPPCRLTNQGLEWPLPNLFLDVQHGADWNTVRAATMKNIKVTLNCWREAEGQKPGAIKSYYGKDMVELHFKRGENGKWRRQDCDKEWRSRRVEGSGNRLFGTNVTMIYLET